MRNLPRAAAVTALLAVTACSAAAPPATAQSQAPAPQRSHARVSYQAGIDLDFYWRPGMRVAADITADARYARRLGANTVMISFPFYTNGRTASAGPATPPAAVVAQAIKAARAQGLTVGVRPLLDEKNLRRSRTKFMPASAGAWLASYATLLVHYASTAQQAGASRFWAGAELSKFATAPGWARVTAAVRKVFRGRLYFAANWVSAKDTAALPGSGGPGAAVTVDAYQGMPVPVSRFTADWKAKAAVLPAGTVLSEVGIAARWGAQWKPYTWAPSNAPLDPGLQAAWFTAACHAVTADHLGGIYFWSVNVGRSLTTRPTPRTANQFTDSPAATAIKACFTELRAAS